MRGCVIELTHPSVVHVALQIFGNWSAIHFHCTPRKKLDPASASNTPGHDGERLETVHVGSTSPCLKFYQEFLGLVAAGL
jgi:hypothetical protein